MATMGTAQPAQSVHQDDYDAIMNPPAPSLIRTYHGEVTTTDYYACVLERGTGKRLFDPTRDDPDRKRWAIKLIVQPFNKDWDVPQEVLNTDKEWREHTLPSLKKLGLDFLSLKGKFVRVERVPTGEFYVNKEGVQKDRTAVVFVEVYPDREACQRAADGFWEKRKAADASNTNAQSTAASAQAQPPTDMAEREFAKSSLSMLWQVSGQNKDQFLNMIRSNEMIAKYFSEDSDEVQAILSPELMP